MSKKLSDKIIKMARKLAEKWGAEATPEKEASVEQFMPNMKKGPLKTIWDKVISIWEAFKSADTPIPLKAFLIGSLIYMVSPIDVIPDITPVVGLLDDVAVITIAFTSLSKIISKKGPDSISNVVKTGITELVKSKIPSFMPLIDKFFLKQWIKTGVQLFTFIVSALILVFSPEKSFIAMYISSSLLLFVIIFFLYEVCVLLQ